MTEQKEEIRSVNEKVLTFGIMTVLVLLISMCAVLVFFLYSATSDLSRERERVIEEKHKIMELQASVYDLRRALDKAYGKLSVYEDYLVGTQVSAFKKLVRRFLQNEQVKSDQVTLEQFESWVGDRVGIGGR
jgi:hypothetical protein